MDNNVLKRIFNDNRIIVFIDTNIFEEMGFNFDLRNEIINQYVELCKKNKIKNIIVSVIDKEIKKHISNKIEENRRAIKKNCKWIYDLVDKKVIEDNLNKNLIDYEKFKNETNSEIIEIDNIKEKFHIDIVTGDPITPKEINYKYKPILDDRYVKLWAYNIETVLAEKMETILNRVELNGRMRDFYDIYLIYTKDWDNVNLEDFVKAIEKTFYKREYVGEPLLALDLIMDSDILKERWKSYQKRYEYARNIDFDEILICLEKIINVIVLKTV